MHTTHLSVAGDQIPPTDTGNPQWYHPKALALSQWMAYGFIRFLSIDDDTGNFLCRRGSNILLLWSFKVIVITNGLKFNLMFTSQPESRAVLVSTEHFFGIVMNCVHGCSNLFITIEHYHSCETGQWLVGQTNSYVIEDSAANNPSLIYLKINRQSIASLQLINRCYILVLLISMSSDPDMFFFFSINVCLCFHFRLPFI